MFVTNFAIACILCVCSVYVYVSGCFDSQRVRVFECCRWSRSVVSVEWLHSRSVLLFSVSVVELFRCRRVIRGGLFGLGRVV